MDPQDIYGGLSTGSGFMPWLMGQLKNGAAGLYNGFANAPPINTTPNAVASRPAGPTPNAAGVPGMPGTPSGPAAPAAPPLPQARPQQAPPAVGNPMSIAPPWAQNQASANAGTNQGQGLLPRFVNSLNGASANANGQPPSPSQGILPRLGQDIQGMSNWFKGLNMGNVGSLSASGGMGSAAGGMGGSGGLFNLTGGLY